MPTDKPRTTKRISSLDGLRGLCIIAVIFGHLCGTGGFPVSAHTEHIFSLGALALLVFFVLSGFLITGMILDEQKKTGRVRLGRFYFRRTLRMAPPYFAAVAGLTAMSALGWITLNHSDVWYALTYTSNYHPDRSWSIAHTWSASVQEQFYLLWPLVLVLAGTRRAVFVAALTILAIPLIRVGEYSLLHWEPVGHRFETIADSMAAGCVLACVRPRLHKLTPYVEMLRARWFVIVPLIAIAANMLRDHPRASYGAGLTISIICITLSLDWIITYPEGRVGQVLNISALRGIGLISYSLYLWQQPFINRESTAFYAQFPLNLGFALTAGMIAFFAVEKPTLDLRKRIDAKRKNKNVPVVADPRVDDPAPTDLRPAVLDTPAPLMEPPLLQPQAEPVPVPTTGPRGIVVD